jgi:hypothetical protein
MNSYCGVCTAAISMVRWSCSTTPRRRISTGSQFHSFLISALIILKQCEEESYVTIHLSCVQSVQRKTGRKLIKFTDQTYWRTTETQNKLIK